MVLFPWDFSPLRAFPGHEAAVLALLVIVLQFTTELFMTRHYGLAMVSFTPVILLMTQLAAPSDPHVLVTERAVETLLGRPDGHTRRCADPPAAVTRWAGTASARRLPYLARGAARQRAGPGGPAAAAVSTL